MNKYLLGEEKFWVLIVVIALGILTLTAYILGI